MVTTYEYDDESGRLVRAVTVQEPEWLDDDRDWATAHLYEERGKCPGCGMPLDETTGEHNAGRWEAPPPLQCHACEVKVIRQDEWAAPEFDARDKVFHVRRKD